MRARRRGRYRKPITEGKAKSAAGAERHGYQGDIMPAHCQLALVSYLFFAGRNFQSSFRTIPISNCVSASVT
jgi:hypothetical protein